MKLNIELRITIGKGAKVELAPKEKLAVERFVEQLLMEDSGSKAKRGVVTSKKRWTMEEDSAMWEYMKTHRQGSISDVADEFSKKFGRTQKAVAVRASKILALNVEQPSAQQNGGF